MTIQDYLSYTRIWAREVERITNISDTVQTRLTHLTAIQNNAKALDILIRRYGVSENLIDEDGWNIAKQDCEQLAKSFINETGWTVLHTAVFHGHVETFELLVNKHNALVGKDKHYVTDMSILALRNGHIKLWSMLVEKHGADF